MIKIGDFEFERYMYGWVLIEERAGIISLAKELETGAGA